MPDGLSAKAGAPTALKISSPQTTGLAGGEWCPYGLGKVAPEMPLDQRIDDAGSLVFDSAPLEKHALLVGDPLARLELSVDKPLAFVAVRLSDVAPDGQVTKVTYGLQNLAQRASQAEPSKLVPGQRYQIRVRLNEIAHQFEPGHRIRISVSTSYFPLVWPSPEPVTLTLQAGESSIELPFLRKEALKVVEPFEPAEQARPRPSTVLVPGHDIREIHHDLATGRVTVRISRDDGWTRIEDIGTEVAYGKTKEMSVVEGDPLSKREVVTTSHSFRRGDWNARLDTKIVLTCDKDNFYLQSDIDAYADGATDLQPLQAA